MISQIPFLANFRCPICGDSERNLRKARGFIIEKKDSLYFYCHNCGSSMSLRDFISDLNYNLFIEYKLEYVKEKYGKIKHKEEPKKEPKETNKYNINFGKLISDLLDTDECKQYILDRKIPSEHHNSIHACYNLKEIIHQIDKYKNVYIPNEPFIVIPFYDKNREYSYVTCRTIREDSSIRYLVFEINELLPKIWGIEKINWNEDIFVFEGPIDAMYVGNSIAMAGNISVESLVYLKEKLAKSKTLCFVYDNDVFYNKNVFNQVKKRIKEGFNVVIFDKRFTKKDVSAMISSCEMSRKDIYFYLKERTFSGLKAVLELANKSKTLYRGTK
jgi:hypothetical protein